MYDSGTSKLLQYSEFNQVGPLVIFRIQQVYFHIDLQVDDTFLQTAQMVYDKSVPQEQPQPQPGYDPQVG